MTAFPPSDFNPSANEQDVINLIYGAALDASLWPELIAAIFDQLHQSDAVGGENEAATASVLSHLPRAIQISEKMISLQEQNELSSTLLNKLMFEFRVFGHSGQPIELDGLVTSDQTHIQRLPSMQRPAALGDAPDIERVSLLFGPEQVRQIGLPPSIGWLKITYKQDIKDIVDGLPDIQTLPLSRRRLLSAFLRFANLRLAAEDISVSYQTARTYFKDICTHFGVSGQAELLKTVLLAPSTRLGLAQGKWADRAPRKAIHLRDGRVLEYFVVGDPTAHPILHFDAMSGGAIDVLAHPERYQPLLDDLAAQLIVPCRPGTFGSTFKAFAQSDDYSKDIEELCDQLELERFSVLAYSYGTVPALHVAQGLSRRLERLIIASGCFPNYVASHWRQLDYFYQLTWVIGRYWPSAHSGIVPFLIRSVLQNTDNYADKAAARATCEHERAILMDPEIRKRSREMLADRVAHGMEGMIEETQMMSRELALDWSRFDMPVEIFHGTCDQINPIEGARELAKHLPTARLHELPNMGHAFLYAEWDWLLRAAIGETVIPPAAASRRGILRRAEGL